MMRAVNPFIDRIPFEDKEFFMDDVVAKLIPKCKEEVVQEEAPTSKGEDDA